MGLNSYSSTNPTEQTQTLNTNYNPYDRQIAQSNFQTDRDSLAVYGGHFPGEAFRPAGYQQDWSGLQYWQTWSIAGAFLNENEYPVDYRAYITRGNAADTAQLLLYRNQPQQYAPAPIAISQYALNTQQVYVGSDYYG